jgi:hypothetical protein
MGQGGVNRLKPTLHWPTDLAKHPNGSLYIADWGNWYVRKIDADGGFYTTISWHREPTAVTTDASGNIYLTYYSYHNGATIGGYMWAVRKYDADHNEVWRSPDIWLGHPSSDLRGLATDGTYVWVMLRDWHWNPDWCAVYKLDAATGAFASGNAWYVTDRSGMYYKGIAVDATHIYLTASNGNIDKKPKNGVQSDKSDETWFTVVGSPDTLDGITFDASGNLLISDYDGKVYRYTTTGTLLETINVDPQIVDMEELSATRIMTLHQSNLAGSGSSGFTNLWEKVGGVWGVYVPPAPFVTIDPRQITRDAAGNIYIADYGNNRLLAVNSSGVVTGQVLGLTNINGVHYDAATNVLFVTYQDVIARYTTGLGYLNHIDYASSYFSHVATSPDFLYVVRPETNVVLILNKSTLAYVRYIGGPGTRTGQLRYPWGIAAGNGLVYVVDQGNFRVQAFQLSDDKWIGEWGGEGTGNGQFLYPSGVAVAPITGNVYVTDTRRGDVQVFSHNGHYLGKFGLPWSDVPITGVIRDPASVVTGPSDEAYVMDAFFDRVTRFDVPNIDSSSQFGLTGEVEISGPYVVDNGDFEEEAITPWVYWESAAFTEAVSLISPGADGTGFAGRVAISAAPATQWAKFGLNHPTRQPGVEGQWYTVRAMVRRSSLNYLPYLYINFYHLDDTGETLLLGTSGNTGNLYPMSNVWGEIEFAAKAPTWTTHFEVGAVAVGKIASAGAVNFDVDDLRIDTSVHSIYPAELLGGNSFSLVTTPDEIPLLGTYDVRVRGRDINGPGPFSNPQNFQYVAGPTATILEPESGEVLNTVTPIVRWFMTNGEQWRFRIEAMDALTGVIVYDSDWITDPVAREFRIPSGYLEDGGSYLARLWIDDSNLQVLA